MVTVVINRTEAEDKFWYHLKLMKDGYICQEPKLVGTLQKDDGRFIKMVDKDKHYFRKYEGYAISKSLYDKLVKDGCRVIVFIEELDGEWNRTLVSEIDKWERCSEIHKSEGYEEQLVMPESNMYITS